MKYSYSYHTMHMATSGLINFKDILLHFVIFLYNTIYCYHLQNILSPKPNFPERRRSSFHLCGYLHNVFYNVVSKYGHQSMMLINIISSCKLQINVEKLSSTTLPIIMHMGGGGCSSPSFFKVKNLKILLKNW
jgi:hypothetical protein